MVSSYKRLQFLELRPPLLWGSLLDVQASSRPIPVAPVQHREEGIDANMPVLPLTAEPCERVLGL